MQIEGQAERAGEHPSAMESLVRPEVAGLPAYDPGADPDEVSRSYGPTRIIKLSNNESPYGVSAGVVEAVRRRLAAGVARYPDPMGKRLAEAIGDKLAVSTEHVILGNGSENILELLSPALLGAGDIVTIQAPCFSLHEIFPRMMGARVDKVPFTADFGFDTAGWLRALAADPKIVFIASPSNPTGVILDREQLDTILDATPETALVVLDDAYHEYAMSNPSYPDGLEVLRGLSRPWIVLRTFSKAYGLAGLRVGYGIASDARLVDALNRVRTPYNVNQVAQDAAVAALDDQAHLAETVRRTGLERTRITKALRAAGFRVAPSASNFLFIDTEQSAVVVAEQLLRSGIIVKPWREPGYEGFIRASLSLPEENDVFVRRLLEICALGRSNGDRPSTYP
ncbi:histidinol-phosphate transaminase [Herbihabitans rhizosphaerae]|uniref:histidinol-phosphate transaminase n=1 Tax=Herbihabitans rhizosphaerae TaxID=1872711 RepID=UPI001F5F6323|nr:histidinol-phosphate transaminase [Herbihabitans rhizosphaerae]